MTQTQTQTYIQSRTRDPTGLGKRRHPAHGLLACSLALALSACGGGQSVDAPAPGPDGRSLALAASPADWIAVPLGIDPLLQGLAIPADAAQNGMWSPAQGTSGAEIYYPARLFRSSGAAAEAAPRPLMAALSGLAYEHGDLLQIDMTSSMPISQLVLVAAGSAVQALPDGQVPIALAFSQLDGRLSARLPAAALVPSGYYQVIAIGASGVPSAGVIIAIGPGISAPLLAAPLWNVADIS